MAEHIIDNVKWYTDPQIAEIGCPGIIHSFMSSLATSLHHIDKKLDPAELLGVSSFAFRIFVNETMCPSAMSIFNWQTILPEAVARTGRQCHYFSRMWDETEQEQLMREKAHAAICRAIEDNIPPVVWDICAAEWGLIIGYNTDERYYRTLTNNGQPATLPFARLGQNGINILSVTIPGPAYDYCREDVIRHSLIAAVNHAEQREWTDRPEYQNGLAAYDLWALVLERWALLIENGKSDKIGVNIGSFASYYANHHFSARYYARNYLSAITDGDEHLANAREAFSQVADYLKTIWENFKSKPNPEPQAVREMANILKSAKRAEAKGIEAIKDYLAD